MVSSRKTWRAIILPTFTAFPCMAVAEQILRTSSFTSCNGLDNSTIQVNHMSIIYNNSNKTVVFDVAGTSKASQNVSATLHVQAYGKDIYSRTFDPCDQGTYVYQLCPVPKGTFSAKGSQKIPKEYTDMVPALAFQVPDITAQATLELKTLHGDQDVACIQSQVTNGKTADVPAVSYVAAGIAATALILAGTSAVSAAMAGGGAALGGSSPGGLGTPSPSFTEVFGWFQGMAMNGMLSVNYPPVYRSFTKNFGFSTGAIGWSALQTKIDDFRSKTGGNLTSNSVEALKNSTLVFPDGSTTEKPDSVLEIKRALHEFAYLASREVSASINNTGHSSGSDSGLAKPQLTVSGITAYAEELSVPKSNVFMTALLVVATVILAIVLGVLLVKAVLEIWALFGSFPQSLAGFRKHYWGSIARTITSLVLLVYGIWVLYCVFQFTNGDSVVAKVLAGVTLGLFTGILAFFSWKIWHTARRLRKVDGDARALYDDKSIWVKYSLFYESYRKDYWWIFVPTIVYMFAKGCTLAMIDGHGMAQTIAQLIIESIMLALLLWSRPYEVKSGNVVNIVIQVVRVLSVVCILVFVEEFGIAQTTQTVMGVVLIAVQSALTGILAILIAWNAIAACCKDNPHRKRRKEMEKWQRDSDALTPLDAILFPPPQPHHHAKDSVTSVTSIIDKPDHSVHRSSVPTNPYAMAEEGLQPPIAPSGGPLYRHLTPTSLNNNSRQSLTTHPAPFGLHEDREPTLPNIGPPYQGGYNSVYRCGNSGYGGAF